MAKRKRTSTRGNAGDNDEQQRNPFDDTVAEQEEPFPEDEHNRTAQDLADEAADPRYVDLEGNEPPPFDAGHSGTPVMGPDGRYTRTDPTTVGRSHGSPLWTHAHLNKAYPQYRVWKVVNGLNVDVGAIDSMASEDTVIRYFLPSMPKDGEGVVVFIARPMDAQGNLAMREFEIIRLGPDHATLRKVRAEVANQGAGNQHYPPPPPAVDPFAMAASMQGLINQAMAPMVAQLTAAQEQARLANQTLMDQYKTAADERTEMSARLGGSVQEITEKLLARNADASSAAAKQQGDFMTSIMAMQQAQAAAQAVTYERERKEAEARRKADLDDAAERRRLDRLEIDAKIERDRKEAEAKAERDRIEAERTLAKEIARAEARAAEEQRRYEQRVADDERKFTRERDEQRRRDEEREAERNRQQQVILAEIASSAQRDREHAERMMLTQRQDSPSGAIKQISDLAANVGIDLKEVAQAFVKRIMEPPPTPEPSTDIAETIAGLTQGIGDAFVKPIVDLAKAVKAAEAMKAQGGGMPPALIGTGQAPVQQQAQGQAPPAPAPTANPAAPPAGAPRPQDQFDLRTQKQYRESLQQGIQKLRNSPESEWALILTQLNASEPGLYGWFKALSIAGALSDIGCDAAFIETVLNHPALLLLPSEVPRR